MDLLEEAARRFKWEVRRLIALIPRCTAATTSIPTTCNNILLQIKKFDCQLLTLLGLTNISDLTPITIPPAMKPITFVPAVFLFIFELAFAMGHTS